MNNNRDIIIDEAGIFAEGKIRTEVGRPQDGMTNCGIRIIELIENLKEEYGKENKDTKS